MGKLSTIGFTALLGISSPSLAQDIGITLSTTTEEIAKICPGGYRDDIPQIDISSRTVTFKSYCLQADGTQDVATAVVDEKTCVYSSDWPMYKCPAKVEKIINGESHTFTGCLLPDTAIDRFSAPYVDQNPCPDTSTLLSQNKEQ